LALLQGRDWFYKIDLKEDGSPAPDFFRLTLKASETGIIKPEELESLKSGLTDEQYAQEFECSFEAAVIGAYYGKLMGAADADKRITGSLMSLQRRYTRLGIWAFGIRQQFGLLRFGREIRIIDYYESSGVDLGHYVREIGSKPYLYAGHIVPA
jgi:phage terminase large subunit